MKKSLFFLPIVSLSFFFIVTTFAFAQLSAKSQCIVTKVGNPSNPAPTLPPDCATGGTPGDGGIGIADGFTFPLKTTKLLLLAGSTYKGTLVWCYASQANCHHDYNAADIFAKTGTIVVAAVSGKVSQTAATSSVGHVVTILGDDKYTYYHAHMGSIKVSLGQTIKAGDEIGAVGTAADAVYTAPHLHFDKLPPGQNGKRPVCSGAACKVYPFINIQPLLIKAYLSLPQ
jgi:hypothetical protein